MVNPTAPIDCACVIHGDGYTWQYVERLYNMLNRHIAPGIRLHVYTESTREVPSPMIKHELDDWGISGPKQSWWYKMQLFNSNHHAGTLLYFDLDTVIVKNIDWIWKSSPDYFWGVRDFKYLWRPTNYGLNSSIMWWDTRKFNYVWEQFSRPTITQSIAGYHGDQDYITQAIAPSDRRFFDITRIKSWRWECLDGGYNFQKKRYNTPNAGTVVSDRTNVLVFHGNPKPNEVQDSMIIQHWQ